MRVGEGYLYVLANRLDVPATVMFYPTGPAEFTAFDPTRQERTDLRFDDENTLTIEAASGRRIAGPRS